MYSRLIARFRGETMNNVASAQPQFATLLPGDPAPWRSGSNPRFAFDTVAGRYVVLGFYGSAGDPRGRQALAEVIARRAFFDDERAAFFGVSLDPEDEAQKRVTESMPGLRF